MPVLKVKSDCRATNTPPTLTIALNTSNQNFETAIFTNVSMTMTTPAALGARIVIYALGSYKAFIEKEWSYKLRRGSLDRLSEVLNTKTETLYLLTNILPVSELFTFHSFFIQGKM